MTKEYLFYPIKDDSPTLRIDIVIEKLPTIYAARSFASELLQNFGTRYDRIKISEVIARGTVEKPFALGNHDD